MRKKMSLILLAVVMLLGICPVASSTTGPTSVSAWVEDIHIVGNYVVGETLKAMYTIVDESSAIDKAKTDATIVWYAQNRYGSSSSSYFKKLQTGGDTYTITTTAVNSNNYSIFFKFVPTDASGNAVFTDKNGSAVTFYSPLGSHAVAAASAPATPVAANASILPINYPGTMNVGDTVVANFSYKGPVGTTVTDVNSANYEWYVSDTLIAEGSEAETLTTPISGATGRSYKIKAEDAGKWLYAKITPKAGTTLGNAVYAKNHVANVLASGDVLITNSSFNGTTYNQVRILADGIVPGGGASASTGTVMKGTSSGTSYTEASMTFDAGKPVPFDSIFFRSGRLHSQAIGTLVLSYSADNVNWYNAEVQTYTQSSVSGNKNFELGEVKYARYFKMTLYTIKGTTNVNDFYPYLRSDTKLVTSTDSNYIVNGNSIKVKASGKSLADVEAAIVASSYTGTAQTSFVTGTVDTVSVDENGAYETSGSLTNVTEIAAENEATTMVTAELANTYLKVVGTAGIPTYYEVTYDAEAQHETIVPNITAIQESIETNSSSDITTSGYQQMGTTGVYDSAVYNNAIAWLTDQTAVSQTVADANALPAEDSTVYTIAKSSVIIRAGSTYGYINGYRMYLDNANTALCAINQNDVLYAPTEFMDLALSTATTFDADSDTITISGTKTLVLTIGSTTMKVNGTSQTIAGAPFVENGGVYVPVEAVSEALSKSVVYDDRGVAVVTTSTIASQVTEDVLDTIAHPQFILKRDKILHPIDTNTMKFMVNTSFFTSINGKRVSNLTTADTTRTRGSYTYNIPAETTRYVNSNYLALASAVDEDLSITIAEDGTVSSTRYIGYKSTDYSVASARPEFERIAAILANEYVATGDEDYALRVIIMLYQYAMRYDNLLRRTDSADFFQKYQLVAPMYAIFAYDKVYNSPMWDVVSIAYGTDAKADIDTWLTTVFDYFYVNRGAATVSNNENCIGHMAGIAAVLDDAEMMHKTIKRLDKAVEHFPYYADGMWYEGSSSYARTAAGYAIEGIDAMKSYREKRNYVDSDGIKLDGSLSVNNRWRNFLNYVRNIESNAKIYFPDGSPIALNDTSWQKVSTNLADINSARKYYKSNAGNIELNHFGLYGLRHGDSAETQQLNLYAQAVTGVSHMHNSPLGISYYSGGMELLPDIGYVPTTDARYAKIIVSAHNTAHASELENPAYTPTEDGSFNARANVLAYDDGSTNDNKIQLIEGSNLMHSSSEVDVNRRALMMIETEGNLSYALDIHRIKGAEARESYLLQTEEEEVDFETSLTLPAAAGEDVTLPGWLSTTMNKTDGYVTTHPNSGNVVRTAALKNPQGMQTSDDFWFTWKGKTTGTTMKAFIKGNDDSIVAFSQWPTSRILTEEDTAHNGYHFYRSRNETADKVTTFGALYEGYKDGTTGKVTNVTWVDPADGNDMTTMAKVTLSLTDGTYYDYIYVSNDSLERAFENFTFSGSYAMVRVNESGEVVQSYVYGAGTIKNGTETVNAGGATLNYTVTSADGTRVKDTSVPNQLEVSESLSSQIDGLWGNVSFSDGSGAAFRVEDVDLGNKLITIHNNPGFKMTDTGAEFTAYPMYEDAEEAGKIGEFASAYPSGNKNLRTVAGTVTFTVKTPNFIN